MSVRSIVGTFSLMSPIHRLTISSVASMFTELPDMLPAELFDVPAVDLYELEIVLYGPLSCDVDLSR